MTSRRAAAPRAAPHRPRRRAADAPRRAAVAAQLCSYLDKYSKALIVHADNVGSNQLMMIRKARGRPAARRAAPGGRAASGLRWAARRCERETLNPARWCAGRLQPKPCLPASCAAAPP